MCVIGWFCDVRSCFDELSFDVSRVRYFSKLLAVIESDFLNAFENALLLC